MFNYLFNSDFKSSCLISFNILICRFNSFTNTWCVLKPMQVPRSHFGITLYDNRVYCVGGSDSIHNLNSVIKYNTSTDMWHNVVSMNTKRVSAAAVTVIVPKIQDE